MRFVFGAVPKPEELPPSDGWVPLREPKPALMQWMALPLGAILAAGMTVLWIYATPVAKYPAAHPALLIIWLVILIPVHETLHLMIHPHMGLSDKTTLGFWPSLVMFYTGYNDVLSRERFLLILAMPLMVLTAGPFLFCSLADHSSVTLAFVSTFNVLAASGDIFAIGLLLWQVPPKARLLNHGWRTYWKPGF